MLVALVWGSTFVLVKDAVVTVPVFPFLAFRFAVGAVVLWALSRAAGTKYDARALGAGSILGVALFAGYALQTAGLLHTTASKAGFITGLNVILVPIGAAALLRARPSGASVAGAMLSAAGMAFLCLQEVELPGKGDLLLLGCAFAFALQVLLVAKYSRQIESLALCTVQLAMACLLSVIAGLVVDGATAFLIVDWSIWGAIGFLGIAATAGAFLLQMIAQKRTTATRTALILALEPVFAALFSWLLAGETLSFVQWGGGVLILGGIILSEIGPAE